SPPHGGDREHDQSAGGQPRCQGDCRRAVETCIPLRFIHDQPHFLASGVPLLTSPACRVSGSSPRVATDGLQMGPFLCLVFSVLSVSSVVNPLSDYAKKVSWSMNWKPQRWANDLSVPRSPT